MADINFYSGIDITGDLNLSGAFYDTSGSAGSNGQVLSSTGTGTDWIDDVGTNIGNSNLTITDTTRTLKLASAGSFQILDNSGIDLVLFTSSALSFVKPLVVMGSTTVPGQISLRQAPDNGFNSISLKAPASLAASNTYTLPDAFPASDKVLQSTSSGVMSWVSGGGGTNIGTDNLTIDDTSRTLTLESTGGNASNFTIKRTNTTETIIQFSNLATLINDALILTSTNINIPGAITLREASLNGTNHISLNAPAFLAANNSYTLPDAFPASDKVLQSTSSGVMSWVSGGGGTNIGNTNLTTNDVSRSLTLISNGVFSIIDSNAATVAAFSESTILFNKTVQIISDTATARSLEFRGNVTSGATYVIGLKAPDSVTADAEYTLPQLPTFSKILQSDSSGTMSWISQQNLGNADQPLAADRQIQLSGYDLYIRSGVTGAFNVKFSEGGDIDIYPATAVYSNILYFRGSVTTSGRTGIRSQSSSSDIVFTLPNSLPATAGKYLTASTTGEMSWATFDKPLSIIWSGGGVMDFVAATDNNANAIVCGGGQGFNDQRWNVVASNSSPGTVEGTPGTTVLTNALPNNLMGGIFSAKKSGNPSVNGFMKFGPNVGTSVDIFIRLYKVPTAFNTDMSNGDDPGTTIGDCVLVASTTLTTPSSDPDLRPMRYNTGSNFVSVSFSDNLFLTVTYSGIVGRNGAAIMNNFQVNMG